MVTSAGTLDHGLGRFIERMPKVELHVHLEGAIRPATLLALASRRRSDLPATDAAGLRRWMRFRDFEEFVHVYLVCSGCLWDPTDFQRLVLEFMEDQAARNVRYSEAHFTIASHLSRGINGREVGEAMAEAIADGEARHGVKLRLITDVVRNLGPGAADQTLEWALSQSQKSVVALGLSGFESFANEPFREHFEVAASEGLGRVAHAGEHEGPWSIRSVLEVCSPQRLGHGVRATEDPELVEQLAAARLPLEICPTSNLRLGLYQDLSGHPFERLRAAGVEVTVNSDDPLFFDTDLTRELAALARVFGYGARDLGELSLTAVRHSFLPPEEGASLAEQMRGELGRLAEELHGEPSAGD